MTIASGELVTEKRWICKKWVCMSAEYRDVHNVTC